MQNNKKLLLISFIVILIALLCTGMTVLALYLLRNYSTAQIVGSSMEPNYSNGEYFFTQKNFTDLNRGDVFIYTSGNTNTRIVNRIIGLPEEKIKISSGIIYINGDKLEESYNQNVETEGYDFLKNDEEYTIPADQYVFMGDNRNQSLDSRSTHIGFINKADINEKVLNCYLNCIN